MRCLPSEKVNAPSSPRSTPHRERVRLGGDLVRQRRFPPPWSYPNVGPPRGAVTGGVVACLCWSARLTGDATVVAKSGVSPALSRNCHSQVASPRVDANRPRCRDAASPVLEPPGRARVPGRRPEEVRCLSTTRRLTALTIAGALLVAGCAAREQASSDQPSDTFEPASQAFPVTLTPAEGEPVTIERQPERIVSLSASNTETLYAVGAGEQVVAVDEQSDYPADAPKTDLSGLTPNVEAISGYDPDLVVISDDAENLVAVHVGRRRPGADRAGGGHPGRRLRRHGARRQGHRPHRRGRRPGRADKVRPGEDRGGHAEAGRAAQLLPRAGHHAVQRRRPRRSSASSTACSA